MPEPKAARESKDQVIIQEALQAIDALQRELQDLEDAEPVERLRAVLRCRADWMIRASIASVVLTGKKDADSKSKALIGVSVADLVMGCWAEAGDEDNIAWVEDASAGEGMRWKVGVEPSNWSGLSKEKLLLAGVSPEQIQAGTETRSGTKLVVRAVKA